MFPEESHRSHFYFFLWFSFYQNGPPAVLSLCFLPSDTSFYVVDMGSAHGTFVSNERLRKDSPLEIEPGQSVKFAASTRIYMLRKAKLNAETAMPGIRDAGTPPVELPPPPDPSDTEAVVAYHTLVNR